MKSILLAYKYKFCKIIKSENHHNSICPSPEEGYAYGHYFPKDWSEEYIRKILDPKGKNIQQISIIKTKIGQPSGKILFKFTSNSIMENYIKQYNEDYILTDAESHKVVILPFHLKTSHSKKQQREGVNLKYAVRVSNLDFDMTEHQLLKLASDYGEVTHIELNLRLSGINRGFATVYFDKLRQAEQFVNFMDGFLYMDRKLKAQIVEKSKPRSREEELELKLLKVPVETFKANQQLMRRLVRKEQKRNIILSE